MPIAICMRNVAAGTMVLLSAATYLFIFVCLLTAFFWRNKDAHIICNRLQSEQLLYKQTIFHTMLHIQKILTF